MKIGDYVRTKYGIIGKISKKEPFMDTILIFLDNKQGNITLQSKDGVFKVNHIEDIIKSSSNIIDLIEVGDYVNGCYVDEILNADECYDDKKHFHLLKFNSYFRNEDIKSIVTKEQFESMEYKVGE